MTSTDVLIIGVYLCGLLMVFGGLALALRGAVRVKRPRKAEGSPLGLRVEFQGLEMSTDYPAIAVCLIGLLFSVLAVWTDLNKTVTIQMTARLDGVDPAGVDVYAAVPLQGVMKMGGGAIEGEIDLSLRQERIYLVAIAPGGQPPKGMKLPQTGPFTSSLTIDMGTYELVRPVLLAPESSSAAESATPASPAENRPGKY